MASQEIPCPECNQFTAVGQPACVHCGASLLVSVVLAGPVTDARLRFQLAKALVTLPPQGRTFAEVQAALSAPRPVLASNVTAALAQRYLDELSKVGVVGRVERLAPAVAAVAAAGRGMHRPETKRMLPAVAGLVFVVMASLAYLRTQSTSSANTSASRATTGPSTDTVQEAIRSTVAVRCKESRAAGFFISETQLLTNAHAVCPETEMMQIVLHDGRKLLGKTKRRDEKLDLALVEVSGGEGVPLKLADASVLQSGDPVAAIGSPQGLEFTVSRGTVSYVGRNLVGVGYLQIDINVNPGNSGGPVVDGHGRVIGVMSMMMKDANGLGLALPINYAFDGKAAMLDPPQGMELSGWRSLLAKISENDREEAVAARAALGKPGLIGALLKPNGSLIAVLMVRSETKPDEAPVAVELDNGEAGKCDGSGYPIRWTELQGMKDRRLPDQRMGQWLKEHDLTDNLWLGMMQTTLGCLREAVPAHSLLKLKAGHDALEKAIVRAATDDLLVVESASGKAPATREEAAKQSERARLEAEVADAVRVFNACAERAVNMGSSTYAQCRGPQQRMEAAKRKLGVSQPVPDDELRRLFRRDEAIR